MNTNQQIEYWFTEYKDDLNNYLVYFTGTTDVEDLVQEVFIKAIKGLDRYMGRSTPKTWLFSIGRHVAIDHLRKKRINKWLPEEVLHFFKSNESTPDEMLQLNEEMKILYAAINQLKRKYREVLILRGIEGFTVIETAEILNWSTSKVKTTLHRASKELRQIIIDMEERGVSNEALEQ